MSGSWLFASPVSAASTSSDIERLLTFEHESAIYALPIAEVHEVAEAQRICCVPTIPVEQVGVMNWHGDALPVISAELLFAGVDAETSTDASSASGADAATAEPARRPSTDGAEPRHATRAGHVLVVSARDDEPAQFGLPIDRVLGLVDGPRRRRGSQNIIVERRPLEGRVLNVLDPCRLVARAKEVIGRQVA